MSFYDFVTRRAGPIFRSDRDLDHGMPVFVGVVCSTRKPMNWSSSMMLVDNFCWRGSGFGFRPPFPKSRDPNCKRCELFEIGRSHLRNPGVVVGEARF